MNTDVLNTILKQRFLLYFLTGLLFLSLVFILVGVINSNKLISAEESDDYVPTEQIGQTFVPDEPSGDYVPTEQTGQTFVPDPEPPQEQAPPQAQAAPEQPHITYEGGQCIGSHSFWVKQWSDGRLEQVKDHGEIPGQCGNTVDTIVYEGGECIGNHSFWVKKWSNGRLEQIKDHGVIPGQCGNPTETSRPAPAVTQSQPRIIVQREPTIIQSQPTIIERDNIIYRNVPQGQTGMIYNYVTVPSQTPTPTQRPIVQRTIVQQPVYQQPKVERPYQYYNYQTVSVNTTPAYTQPAQYAPPTTYQPSPATGMIYNYVSPPEQMIYRPVAATAPTTTVPVTTTVTPVDTKGGYVYPNATPVANSTYQGAPVKELPRTGPEAWGLLITSSLLIAGWKFRKVRLPEKIDPLEVWEQRNAT